MWTCSSRPPCESSQFPICWDERGRHHGAYTNRPGLHRGQQSIPPTLPVKASVPSSLNPFGLPSCCQRVRLLPPTCERPTGFSAAMRKSFPPLRKPSSRLRDRGRLAPCSSQTSSHRRRCLMTILSRFVEAGCQAAASPVLLFSQPYRAKQTTATRPTIHDKSPKDTGRTPLMITALRSAPVLGAEWAGSKRGLHQ